MRHTLLQLGVVGFAILFAGAAGAQEIVHALSGKVVKIDDQARTL